MITKIICKDPWGRGSLYFFQINAMFSHACVIRKLFFSVDQRTDEQATRSAGRDRDWFVSARVRDTKLARASKPATTAPATKTMQQQCSNATRAMLQNYDIQKDHISIINVEAK